MFWAMQYVCTRDLYALFKAPQVPSPGAPGQGPHPYNLAEPVLTLETSGKNLTGSRTTLTFLMKENIPHCMNGPPQSTQLQAAVPITWTQHTFLVLHVIIFRQ